MSATYLPRYTAENAGQYDRWPELSDEERVNLRLLLPPPPGGVALESVLRRVAGCDRLQRPLTDALAATAGDPFWKCRAKHALLRACAIEGIAFWGWDTPTWRRYLSPVSPRNPADESAEMEPLLRWSAAARQHMIGAAYLLGLMPDPSDLPDVRWLGVGEKVFGAEATGACVARIEAIVTSWGYAGSRRRYLRAVTAEALIRCGQPDLGRIADIDLAGWRQREPRDRRGLIYLLSKALVHLGVVAEAIEMESPTTQPSIKAAAERDVPPDWRAWVTRWEATSTLTIRTRIAVRSSLFKIGRWLAREHPSVTAPDQWDRRLAAEAVGAINHMRLGEFTTRDLPHLRARIGQPLSPPAKVQLIQALRLFFRDAQEWEWIPRRFTPARAFAIPRSIKALIGPKPRTIANDQWAKLVWAGLNLRTDDLPRFGRESSGQQNSRLTFYPEPMLRALALVWLFGGLRSDEIVRLGVGCIRWQQDDIEVPGRPGDVLARDAVCILDVPVNKTGTAFAKPVDPLVGRAITAWEAVRPAQPTFRDRKTGERVHLLFCHRARRVPNHYINHTLIPALCEKAGMPAQDAHGRITSHRARTTIASQLYNAKDRMTLFELQAWLGHHSPASTQHYAKLTPLTLAKAYTDAGYFARNVRAIKVLVDRDAVQSGAAGARTPWQYFDLGHGYCTYSFFEQCPHRMACARCDFYLPKHSERAQLLEAKTNLQRMLVEIPLTDDERAAVEDGQAAVDRLLERLADVPTPAGPTPRSLGRRLPVVAEPRRGRSRSGDRLSRARSTYRWRPARGGGRSLA